MNFYGWYEKVEPNLVWNAIEKVVTNPVGFVSLIAIVGCLVYFVENRNDA